MDGFCIQDKIIKDRVEFCKMGEDSNGLLTIERDEGRRKCPSCSEENKNMIHESTDKRNIISDYPRVYGKKYRCGRCGQEWREK